MATWHLDKPLQVGPVELRGRVFLPAHQPGLAQDGQVTDRYVAYHRQRARSGVSMQVTGATPVAPSVEWADICLWNIDDSIVPGYQRLAAAVREEGGRMLPPAAARRDRFRPGRAWTLNFCSSTPPDAQPVWCTSAPHRLRVSAPAVASRSGRGCTGDHGQEITSG